MNISDTIINLAVNEALKTDYFWKVGCVIFKGKKIISKGHNYPHKSVKKLHPQFQNYKGSIHAEVDAIIKAKTSLKGSYMLVLRISKGNRFKISKPCKNCMKYIEHVGIKKIYYSISEYPYFDFEKL